MPAALALVGLIAASPAPPRRSVGHPVTLASEVKDSHDRYAGQLSPADRELLRQLSRRLAAALPNGRFPEDARRVLARAAPSLSAAEIAALADYASAELFAATQAMQETQMSFNLQYLQLQSQLQNENRQYTMVSNILKTKHDTVKNSIGNIR